MPRRRSDEGPSLESDSFLDIVANVVGILIILIVVAGVRVGHSAAAAKRQQAAAPAARPMAPVVAPRPVIVHLTPAAPPVAPAPSPELLAAIEAMTSETTELRDAAARLSGEAAMLDADITALRAADAAARSQHATLLGSLSRADAGSTAIAAEAAALRATLDCLGAQISDAPAEKVTVVHHRLNPVGREVRGKELHFRVADGAVARVPLEELIGLLKPEIERQKEWIAKYRRHQGSVGPIGGFTMEYVVERQRLSVVDELQQGMQMMRIVVSGWKLTPEPNLATEPIDEALRGDSRFLTALRLAESDTTLTFWVYPDSFDAYRRLQEVAYAAELAVAARPLPHGVPIAGSPKGSRSSSQ